MPHPARKRGAHATGGDNGTANTHDEVLDAFASYVAEAGIFVDEAVAPHRFPGRGVGVVAKGRIKKGTTLMRVPMSAILVPASLPPAFNPTPSPPEDELRAHAKLATYLAFGDTGALGPWRATWPTLGDFEACMPLLWPEDVREVYCPVCARGPEAEAEARGMGNGGGVGSGGGGGAEGGKSRKQESLSFCGHDDRRFTILPPAMTGKWATCATTSDDDTNNAIARGEDRSNNKKKEKKKKIEPTRSSQSNTGPPLLTRQAAKFALDVSAAQRYLLPSLAPTTIPSSTKTPPPLSPPPPPAPAIDLSSPAALSRFTWAWCIVNTRCFHFVAAGASPPSDADEAMVLCPAIDLLNHSDHGCDVQYGAEGFRLVADRAYARGEEILASYGPHSNDFLMVEYGFLIDEAVGGSRNSWDLVAGVDPVVESGLSERDRAVLDQWGYLGGYTVGREGVCWRTEVASRFGVMGRRAWERFLAVGDDDDEGAEGEEDEHDDWNGKGEKKKEKKKKRKRKRQDSTVINGPSGTGSGIPTAIPIPTGAGTGTTKARATGQMAEWVQQVAAEARNSLAGLAEMPADEVERVFFSSTAAVPVPELHPRETAFARRAMLLRRWRQIEDVCAEALAAMGGGGTLGGAPGGGGGGGDGGEMEED